VCIPARLLIVRGSSTGSSSTWVGADKLYIKTSTSKPTGDSVSIRYGIGKFAGLEYIDQVTLDPILVIKHQSIGDANFTKGISYMDGVLGIGPTILTEGTVSYQRKVPTVTDTLWTEVINNFFSCRVWSSAGRDLPQLGHNRSP
jgi:Eukaryotic aspartyl protease